MGAERDQEGVKMAVSKEQFLRYVRVQKSGVTNMWDVGRVSRLSGLGRDTIMDIMKNYSLYAKKLEDAEFRSKMKSMLKRR
jgi:hypothetical protein